MNSLKTPSYQKCIDWLQGFLSAWKQYASFIKGITGLRNEDYETCEAVLELLKKSDAPRKLIDELAQGGSVSKRTLKDTEDFDMKLNKLKVIPLPVDMETKKSIETLCNTCVSLYRFALEINLGMEGRLVD